MLGVIKLSARDRLHRSKDSKATLSLWTRKKGWISLMATLKFSSKILLSQPKPIQTLKWCPKTQFYELKATSWTREAPKATSGSREILTLRTRAYAARADRSRATLTASSLLILRPLLIWACKSKADRQSVKSEAHNTIITITLKKRTTRYKQSDKRLPWAEIQD